MSKNVSVVTWNVNSIKSRLGLLRDFVAKENPDILLLQETKCTDEQFPFLEIEDMGYNIAIHGQKSYNGVAIMSKYPVDDIIKGLPDNEQDEQARYIEGLVSIDDAVLRVASVYVPNGQSPDSDKFTYKMEFFNALKQRATTLLDFEEPCVIGGDYNVAPQNIDVYDPISLKNSICFHPKEQAALHEIMHLGYDDAFRLLYPDAAHYSWWDYRGGSYQHNKGLRIDHLLLSPQATDSLKDVTICAYSRGWERPSDHAPVLGNFAL